MTADQIYARLLATGSAPAGAVRALAETPVGEERTYLDTMATLDVWAFHAEGRVFERLTVKGARRCVQAVRARAVAA